MLNGERGMTSRPQSEQTGGRGSCRAANKTEVDEPHMTNALTNTAIQDCQTTGNPLSNQYGKSLSPSPRVDNLDITVLAGGPGAERDISLQSGRAVYEALRRLGHRATICDINPSDLKALERKADFVFITLHGEFGEDGTVQAMLEQRGMPYCGSNAAASRLAMNKVQAKHRFIEAGVPTPEFAVLREPADKSPIPHECVVVKPVISGSSVDVSIERTPESIRRAADRVIANYGEVMIERYITGPELTVGILGDQALPVCEIRTNREFYDYQAKYLDNDTQYLFDLDLAPELLQRVQTLGLAAHRALGCRVFSRVDVMVEAATLEPYVLEVNTIPGFTSHSLLPKAAARIGLDFDQLCQRIIQLSLNDQDA
jgi:D-alanine-D-alanine ligase